MYDGGEGSQAQMLADGDGEACQPAGSRSGPYQHRAPRFDPAMERQRWRSEGPGPRGRPGAGSLHRRAPLTRVQTSAARYEGGELRAAGRVGKPAAGDQTVPIAAYKLPLAEARVRSSPDPARPAAHSSLPYSGCDNSSLVRHCRGPGGLARYRSWRRAVISMTRGARTTGLSTGEGVRGLNEAPEKATTILVNSAHNCSLRRDAAGERCWVPVVWA